jgi:hypothetical protein
MSEEITKRLPESVPSVPLQSSPDDNLYADQKPGKRRPRLWPYALALVTLLVGFILGLAASLLFVLAHSAQTSPVISSPTQTGNVLVQANPALLTLITEKSLPSAGIPGSFTGIHFQLANGDRMTMTGLYTYSIFGIGLTQPFTMQMQPYIHSCQLQINVTSVSIAGISITSFVTAFESKINQELKLPRSGLPDGLTYCMTSVKTETSGLYVNVKVTSK